MEDVKHKLERLEWAKAELEKLNAALLEKTNALEEQEGALSAKTAALDFRTNQVETKWKEALALEKSLVEDHALLALKLREDAEEDRELLEEKMQVETEFLRAKLDALHVELRQRDKQTRILRNENSELKKSRGKLKKENANLKSEMNLCEERAQRVWQTAENAKTKYKVEMWRKDKVKDSEIDLKRQKEEVLELKKRLKVTTENAERVESPRRSLSVDRSVVLALDALAASVLESLDQEFSENQAHIPGPKVLPGLVRVATDQGLDVDMQLRLIRLAVLCLPLPEPESDSNSCNIESQDKPDKKTVLKLARILHSKPNIWLNAKAQSVRLNAGALLVHITLWTSSDKSKAPPGLQPGLSVLKRDLSKPPTPSPNISMAETKLAFAQEKKVAKLAALLKFAPDSSWRVHTLHTNALLLLFAQHGPHFDLVLTQLSSSDLFFRACTRVLSCLMDLLKGRNPNLAPETDSLKTENLDTSIEGALAEEPLHHDHSVIVAESAGVLSFFLEKISEKPSPKILALFQKHDLPVLFKETLRVLNALERPWDDIAFLKMNAKGVLNNIGG